MGDCVISFWKAVPGSLAEIYEVNIKSFSNNAKK